MIGWLRAVPLIVFAQAAVAEATLPPLTCFGSEPEWKLSLTQDSAQMKFVFDTVLDIPLITTPDGRTNPRAFTLIGETDTAILLLNERVCRAEGESHPYEAHVLTQRNQTPVLLVGCCVVTQ